MLKERNAIRDISLFVILIGLIYYNAREQYIKHASATTIAKHVISTGLNKITDTVSDTFTELGKITKREVKKNNFSREISLFSQQANRLTKQLILLEQKITQEQDMTISLKEKFLQRVKTAKSKVEHLKQEFSKDISSGKFIAQSLAKSAIESHKKNIKDKMLKATQNVLDIVKNFSNNFLDEESEIVLPKTIDEGLEINSTLLQAL